MYDNNSNNNNNNSNNEVTTAARVRERQWMYLGPIMAAPLAHIGVTLYRSAKTPIQKRMVAFGIVGATVGTLAMRGILMYHAGYPGGPNLGMSERELIVTSLKEKDAIENPSNRQILRQALRGFG